ncbi:winged helix-turn-helix domain-containing protein [Micromonospora echinofusca]|uniref:Helix-turn-helix domain-containing protein n=1 Tax=Micromonospora echinofusca TaxID=47858 RepID=A0ABS3VZC7_MICEH|nr:helix-turn-helix domain-containing protein [Micromonospora echinofusca]MBO4209688.1 helix-turn-helix domain-containing protein [Micromonospora echinofusca]
MPERDDQRTVHLDSRQIRVLAHPLRIRLLGILRAEGPATATMLAHTLDTNTGATSYHLRQLADVGLVVEDPDRGTARQRWWRSAHHLSSWEPTDFDHDPDARAAAEWIQADQVRILAEQADRWLAVQHDYSREWRDVAGMGDILLTLGPARLRTLTDELWQVIERYRNDPTPDDEDAQQVVLFLAGYPRPRDTR